MSLAKVLPHARSLRFGRFSESGRVYFVTKCLDRSLGVNLTAAPLASRICEAILHRKRASIWHLLVFVVMPDHLHLLIALGGKESLSSSVADFSRFTASEINAVVGRQGRLWQHGFHEHAVRKAAERCPALTSYIHHNPVRKGLCESPEQWPWSTANTKWAPEVETDWFW